MTFVVGETTSLPDSVFVPDQAPDAEQLVEFDVDHANVEELPTTICVGVADRMTVGVGGGAVDGAAAVSSPEPHDASSSHTGSTNAAQVDRAALFRIVARLSRYSL